MGFQKHAAAVFIFISVTMANLFQYLYCPHSMKNKENFLFISKEGNNSNYRHQRPTGGKLCNFAADNFLPDQQFRINVVNRSSVSHSVLYLLITGVGNKPTAWIDQRRAPVSRTKAERSQECHLQMKTTETILCGGSGRRAANMKKKSCNCCSLGEKLGEEGISPSTSSLVSPPPRRRVLQALSSEQTSTVD